MMDHGGIYYNPDNGKYFEVIRTSRAHAMFAAVTLSKSGEQSGRWYGDYSDFCHCTEISKADWEGICRSYTVPTILHREEYKLYTSTAQSICTCDIKQLFSYGHSKGCCDYKDLK